MKIRSQTPSVSALYVVSGALLFSICLLTGMIFFLGFTGEWPMTTDFFGLEEEKRRLVLILAVSAWGPALFSIMAPIFLKQFNPELPSDMSGAEASFGKKVILSFTPFTQKHMTLTIIRMAMGESVVIFGFVCAFLTQRPLFIIPFFLVGLVLQIVVGPFFGRWYHGSRMP